MKELFGQRLREQRQNQGLTMEQLAEKRISPPILSVQLSVD